MNYNRELTLLWIEGIVLLIFALGFILYCFLEKDTKSKKIRLRYKSLKEVDKIIWVAMVMLLLIFPKVCIDNFQDVILKDYQDDKGVFQQYNVDIKSVFTNQIMINNNRYDVPKELIIADENKGKECTFRYTKRKKLILEIEFEN